MLVNFNEFRTVLTIVGRPTVNLDWYIGLWKNRTINLVIAMLLFIRGPNSAKDFVVRKGLVILLASALKPIFDVVV